MKRKLAVRPLVAALLAVCLSPALVKAEQPAEPDDEAAVEPSEGDTTGSPAEESSKEGDVDESELVTARETAISGLAAYDEGRYREAAEQLTIAYSTVKVPTLALYLARSLAQQGQLVEALAYYEEATGLPVARGDRETQERAQRNAQRERQALIVRIPRLRINFEGATPAEVRLFVDDEELSTSSLEEPLSINPGWHQLSAHKGSDVRVQEVQAQIGHEHVVTLSFVPEPPSAPPRLPPRVDEPPAPEPPGWRRPLAWTSLGIGAVGTSVGLVSGLWALDLRRELQQDCPDGGCPPERHDDLDSYRRLRPISTAGFVVGALGIAAGVTLFMSENERRQVGQLRLQLGPSSASLAGEF